MAEPARPQPGEFAALAQLLDRPIDRMAEVGAVPRGTRHRENRLKRADLSDYIRRSDLGSFLDGYVKYNSALAINVASDPSTSQTTGSCLAADLDQEGAVVDKPCNHDAKPALKWQLTPALKSSADNR